MARKEIKAEEDMKGLLPGDYGRDAAGTWWFRAPLPNPPDPDWPKGYPPARRGGHRVDEHKDGTITVSPSLVFSSGSGVYWHGWLRNGIWTKC